MRSNKLQSNQRLDISIKLTNAGFKVFGNGRSIKISNGESFLGSLDWKTKAGWQLTLAQPIIHTFDDLDLAIEEIKATDKACQDVEEKWFEYMRASGCPGKVQALEAYTGAQVTHLLRLHTNKENL